MGDNSCLELHGGRGGGGEEAGAESPCGVSTMVALRAPQGEFVVLYADRCMSSVCLRHS